MEPVRYSIDPIDPLKRERRIRQGLDTLVNQMDRALGASYDKTIGRILDAFKTLASYQVSTGSSNSFPPLDEHARRVWLAKLDPVVQLLKLSGEVPPELSAQHIINNRDHMSMFYVNVLANMHLLGANQFNICLDYINRAVHIATKTTPVISYQKPSTSQLKALEEAFVDPLYLSTRLHVNTRLIADRVASSLQDVVRSGQGIRKAAVVLSKRIEQSRYVARRLVHTEAAKVMNRADQHMYKQAGVRFFQYVATIDARTSDVCRSLDGQIFPLTSMATGVNSPPMHPFCRSTTVPVVDDGLGVQPDTLSTDVLYEQMQQSQRVVVGDTDRPQITSRSTQPADLKVAQDLGFDSLTQLKHEHVAKAQDLLDQAELKTYVDRDSLMSILQDGGMQSSNRVNSLSAQQVRMRTHAEVKAGIVNPKLAVKLKPTAIEHPTYGVLETPGFPAKAVSSRYGGGAFALVFKDELKDRTTCCFTDSANADGAVRVSPVRRVGYQSLARVLSRQRLHNVRDINSLAVKKNVDPDQRYVEAQIYGKISLEDIDRVVLASPPDQDLRTLLERKKLKWTVM